MSDEFGEDEEVQADAEEFEGVIEEGAYISLSVRSLSGAEIHFPQLSVKMMVRELKELIFEQNDKYPVDSQKLIKVSSLVQLWKVERWNLTHTFFVLKGATTLEDEGSLEDVRFRFRA